MENNELPKGHGEADVSPGGETERSMGAARSGDPIPPTDLSRGESPLGRDSEPGPKATIITDDIIRESLQTVVDPEIGFSIVDLGLVYEVNIDEESNVVIRMTLTSPACPVGPEILASAHMAALNTPGVKNVKVDLVWDPPWDPRVHASDDIKLEFGIL